MRRRMWMLSLALVLGGACDLGLGSDERPPYLELLAPTAGGSVAGTVEIRVLAVADGGMKEVRFFVDNVLLSTDTATPFAANWDTKTYADGQHLLRVEAEDLQGRQTSFTVTIRVANNQTPT